VTLAMMYSPGVSERGFCFGDYLCGKQPWCSHPMPRQSKAKMQPLTYVERLGCLGNQLRPEPGKNDSTCSSQRADEGDFCWIYSGVYAE